MAKNCDNCKHREDDGEQATILCTKYAPMPRPAHLVHTDKSKEVSVHPRMQRTSYCDDWQGEE